ncbi:GNAT family N-acetyltransferase [Mucilaginibacter corticis]|uniref:GNAT family N-acetyltransferase n=1 Tax=Mucilaginibacter corticis TaxID=2597670 RepID=A0A556MUT9_9SPHI|nr:GNAT family N-acetyltransferase [Mucilaginibacter corticis]TSJ43704.1 GNAT family N-acetyltransferase [Mucilaginibacter corticis]
MKHVLDNPIFNALASGNQTLAKGSGPVKYFDKDVAPFIGFSEDSQENFDAAYDMISRQNPLIFVSRDRTITQSRWTVLQQIPGWQMVYTGDAFDVDTTNLVALTDDHVPQMIELTKLTNPGPFGLHTIDFGHYYGIFEGDKLVAMAGQRLNPLPYAEISAVCTHPNHNGKGYARQLMQFHVNRIKQAGEIPFLHVRDDNTRAIKVYQDLGFKIFGEVNFYILAK